MAVCRSGFGASDSNASSRHSSADHSQSICGSWTATPPTSSSQATMPMVLRK
jgi:hypothetical protein